MKALPWLLIVGLIGCSSMKKDRQSVNEKMSEEASVTDGKTLRLSVSEAIQNSKTLNETQKNSLGKIFTETRDTSKALLEQSFKLRAVLVKELLAGDVNASEVKLLKKDIRRVEALRLKTTLNAVDKILGVVAKDPNKDLYVERMMFIDRAR